MDHSLNEFQKFAAEYQFEHIKLRHDIRSPTERQRAVLKLQNILKKAADTGHDPHMSLLNFRSTPSAGMDTIPSQRLIHSEPALPCTYSRCEARITTRTEELRSCHHTELEMWCRFDPYHVSQNGLKRKLVVRQPYAPYSLQRRQQTLIFHILIKFPRTSKGCQMNIKCGQRSIPRFDISIADASCFAARFPGAFAKCFRSWLKQKRWSCQIFRVPAARSSAVSTKCSHTCLHKKWQNCKEETGVEAELTILDF